MSLQPKMKRIAWRAAGLLTPVLALAVMALGGQAARAAAWQQETNTDTQTATTAPATSVTPSVTSAGSLTPSVSASVTISATLQTQTSTVTTGVAATLTPTSTPPLLPTATPFIPAQPGTPTPIPTATPPALEPPVTSTPGPPTATLIPFPEVTYQYPELTPTYTLLALQADPATGNPPKGGGLSLRSLLRGVRRAAPLLVLGGLWLALGAWFLIVQVILRKK